MKSYFSALRTGDADAIRSHWSQASLDRPGFEIMHLWIGGTIHISEWSGFLEDAQLTYSLRGVRRGNGYHVIEFEWVPGAGASGTTAASHEMRYYVLREDGRWVLGNPVDVLTQGWTRHEADHLVVFCPPEIDIAEHLVEIGALDVRCGELLDMMDLELDRKIEYYKVGSPHQCGEIVCFPPANGYAVIQLTNDTGAPRWFEIALSTSFNNAHEVMHVLASKARMPYVNAAFCEGLAVACGGTTFQTPDMALVKTKSVMGTSAYVPITSLMTMPDAEFLRASYITYQEAGAFVRFLIDEFGIDRVRRFYDETVALGDSNEAALLVFGHSLDNLETMLHDYLEDIELLAVGTAIPDGAREVFVMEDPAGDDLGDGDYTYPTDGRFRRGSFDLREFAVLKDTNRVYFRLRLGMLIAPVVGVTGERFMPGCVIAMKRGDDGQQHLTRTCHGVGFEGGEGFDVKVAAGFGVCVTDSLGKLVSTSGDISQSILKMDSSAIEFSLPISIVGDPDEAWSYFVGVGLVTDRAMDFFGGPVPVLMRGGPLIGGGNFQYGNPAFIDVLLPPDVDQAGLLSAYDPPSHRLAMVPLIKTP
jgi:hypothetical protein